MIDESTHNILAVSAFLNCKENLPVVQLVQGGKENEKRHFDNAKYSL